MTDRTALLEISKRLNDSNMFLLLDTIAKVIDVAGEVLAAGAPGTTAPVAWMYKFNGKLVFHHARLDHLEWDQAKQDYAKGVPVYAAPLPQPEVGDVRDAARLDFLMDQQLLLAHTRDLEYWGVVQVYSDDGDLCTRTVERLIHDTKRQAVDAAMEKGK